MKKLSLLILSAFILLLSPIQTAADTIGYIDIERIFVNYKESKAINEELQKVREEYQEKVAKWQEKIEKATEKKKSEEKLKELYEEMDAELRPERDSILQKEAEQQRSVLSKVFETAKVVAKEYGIDVVLAKQAVFLGGFDLTEFVLDRLNK